MTREQRDSFIRLVAELDPVQFRHGDCIGADSDAHDIITRYGNDTYIIIHPPKNERYRAFKDGNIILEAKRYLERNKDIVDLSDVLVSCPKTAENKMSGGTGFTIRYALSHACPVIIILPDGTLERYD
ncbi:MAG TPA: hypothetical protein VLG09_02610 [Candidatus Saccharimonadales bacterium]|nr:hypothetical protein [Candidatus Saccharimonadales bacterium]